MGKKHKEKKKHKKDSKRSKNRSSSSSSSEEEWVEKTNPPAERDDWMSMEMDIPGVTTADRRKKKEEEKALKKGISVLEKPGQSQRELNPYWKDGGSGLPSAPRESALESSQWLRKALERATEQSQTSGKSLEEIVSERYGSLDELKRRIHQAEEREGRSRGNDSRRRRDNDTRRRNNDTRRRSPTPDRRRSFKRPNDSPNRDRHRDDKRSGDSPTRERYRDSRRYESNSKRQGWRKQEEKRVVSSPVRQDSAPVRQEIKEATPPESNPPRVLSLDEMNKLGAKIIKAEMMGNEELAARLKKELEAARALKNSNEVILTQTDNKGFTRPVQSRGVEGPSRSKRRVVTHEGRDRVRYFADDDEHTLEDMYEKERFNTADDENATFLKLMSREVSRKDGSLALDDPFEETAAMDDRPKQDRNKWNSAVQKQIKRDKAYDDCRWCLGSKNMNESLIVKTKSKVYLSVPPFQSLTEGHCLIVPNFHVSCATQVDEDVWEEIMELRKELVDLFLAEDEDIIYFENASYLHKHPHMVIHCVPVPKETGDTAPIYFKKALLECEMEWSDNKKVVDLAGRNVRKAVPKGLQYFAVDFGMQSGYAHVIEDLKLFPNNFAQEIIGGMLDLDHTIWRKQRWEKEDQLAKKKSYLTNLFKEHDST